MSEWTTDMMAFIPSQFGSCHFGWFRFCIFGDVKGLCVVGWAKLIYCLGRKWQDAMKLRELVIDIWIVMRCGLLKLACASTITLPHLCYYGTTAIKYVNMCIRSYGRIEYNIQLLLAFNDIINQNSTNCDKDKSLLMVRLVSMKIV